MTMRFRSLLVAIPLIVAGMATPASAQRTPWEQCLYECRQGNPYDYCRDYCTFLYGPPQAAPHAVPLAKLD